MGKIVRANAPRTVSEEAGRMVMPTQSR